MSDEIFVIGFILLMVCLLAFGFWMEERIFAKDRKDREDTE